MRLDESKVVMQVGSPPCGGLLFGLHDAGSSHNRLILAILSPHKATDTRSLQPPYDSIQTYLYPPMPNNLCLPLGLEAAAFWISGEKILFNRVLNLHENISHYYMIKIKNFLPKISILKQGLIDKQNKPIRSQILYMQRNTVFMENC